MEENAALHERQHRRVLACALRLVGLLHALHHEFARLLRLAHERAHLLLRHGDGEGDPEPVHEIVEARVLLAEKIAFRLRHHEVVHHVEDEVVHLLRSSLKDASAQFVDNRPLTVHHVVVFERPLAHGEVLLFDAPLGGLDGLVQPAVLHHLAFLQTEPLHDARQLLRAEEPHQRILERDEELARTGVALTRTAAAQLAVDSPRLVAFRADDVQTAEVGHALAELDVRAAPRHVRRDRHRAAHAGERDDLRLAGVVLRVQHLVRNARNLQHPRQDFGSVDRHRAEQHGLPLLVPLRHVGDDRLELLALGAVDLVVAVDSAHRLVRRNRHHVELVDVLELPRLGLRRAGHAGEFPVEAEVVLDRNRRERLGLLLDLHALLRLDRLVQTVRPAAAGQDAPRELVNDVDVVVLHDVIDVLLVEAVGAEQLVDDVDALALLHERRLRVAAAFEPLGVRKRRVAVNRAHLRGEVGQDEQRRVGRTDLLAPLVRQRDFARPLVNREVEFALQRLRVLLVHLGEHLHLHVLVQLPRRRILQHVHELLVLRHRVVDLVDPILRLLGVAALKRLLRLLNEVVAHRRLNVHNRRHERVDFLIDVARGHRRRPRDNQRRSRLVDENRVHLVHNGEIVPVLHDLLGALRHAVVAQIVEAELRVRAVGDVTGVLGAAFLGIHRVLDAPDR